jgi:hypothetical protein
MKKIITLLFAAAAFVSVQAQTSREEARKVVLGGQKGSTTTTKTPDSRTENPRDVVLGGSTSESSSRQAQIDQVNREYDAKIASIRNNPTLTQEEKDQAIARLERDRARKIRAINNQDDKYDDDDKNSEKKHKNAKGNNGKHLGWEKGVGNPHKNGGSPKGKKKG